VSTGPKGEKRPADVNARDVLIAKMATCGIDDASDDDGKDPAAKALGKKGQKSRICLAKRLVRQEALAEKRSCDLKALLSIPTEGGE
jgi:hypothetical protein